MLAFCYISGICLRSEQDHLKGPPSWVCWQMLIINSYKRNGFAVFAGFHGINTSILTDFKLSSKCHRRKRWAEMHTGHASQLQHPTGSTQQHSGKQRQLPSHSSPSRSSSSCHLSITSPKHGTSFPLLRSPRSSWHLVFLKSPCTTLFLFSSYLFCLRKNFPHLFFSLIPTHIA